MQSDGLKRLVPKTMTRRGNRPWRIVVPALLTLGLSACAGGMHWEHPDTGVRNLAADMAACERLANQESWRYVRPPSLFGPFMPLRDRHGHHRFWRWDPYYGDDYFLRAAELRDFCLRSRGYRLVPDAPAK